MPEQLEPRYYLSHFHEMLSFVERHYSFALCPKHRRFIDTYAQLSPAARCLYVRLANRKGLVFPISKLRYPEIGLLGQPIAELADAKLLQDPQSVEPACILHSFPKEDLVALALQVPKSGELPGKSASKKIWVEALANQFTSLSESLPPFIVQGCADEVNYLLFLFFGKTRSSLTVFALRDLGVMTTNQRTRYETRFADRASALASYFFESVKRRIDQATTSELATLAHQVPGWPDQIDPALASARDRVISRLGRQLERSELTQRALAVYQYSDAHPCRERRARLLYSAGRKAAARDLLNEMINNPSSDLELLFAEDFYDQKFGGTTQSRLTTLLRSAPVLTLDEAGRSYPEGAAVSFLRQRGLTAEHVENQIWRQLFFLVFSDLLFDPEKGQHHSDFDIITPSLANGNFYSKQREEIENRLADWQGSHFQSGELPDASSGLLPLPERTRSLLTLLIQGVPAPAIADILRDMATDFRQNASGYPDLMIAWEGTVQFVEIKSPGDQLQRHQLARIQRLQSLGIPVGLCRVEWAYAPDQEYVVVDVETTGGRSPHHRVTEVGAVRVRGNCIVDEWSSLINPERRIPQHITNLTGITQSMVDSAPRFSDISESLLEFLGDAVFVGHSVKFDFGFIRSEFARCGVTYQAPTICTVVETRRYFPGLKSYSLANLSSHFQIPLDQHHRALCDAKATAKILEKINAQRMLSSTGSQTGSEPLPEWLKRPGNAAAQVSD